MSLKSIDSNPFFDPEGAFPVERIDLETKKVIGEALALKADRPYKGPIPDVFEWEKFTRIVEEREVSFHPKTGKKEVKVTPRRVEDKTRKIDPEKGHCLGGSLSVIKGQYVVFEQGTFMAYPPEDFERRFRRKDQPKEVKSAEE